MTLGQLSEHLAGIEKNWNDRVNNHGLIFTSKEAVTALLETVRQAYFMERLYPKPASPFASPFPPPPPAPGTEKAVHAFDPYWPGNRDASFSLNLPRWSPRAAAVIDASEAARKARAEYLDAIERREKQKAEFRTKEIAANDAVGNTSIAMVKAQQALLDATYADLSDYAPKVL